MNFPLIGEGPVSQERGRQKAIFLLSSSGLIVLAHAVDLFQAGGPNWPALAVRLAWAALLVAAAIVVRRGTRAVVHVVGAATALGSTLAFLGLLGVTGLARSPLFSFTFVLAMLLPPLMGPMIGVGLGCSALLLLGAWGLLALGGVPATDQVGWGHAGAVAFLVGWLLSASELRARRATEDLARTREEALTRLAASEKQRARAELQTAEAERLAAVGRLAAQVAHEMNSPLAAARSNAKFIREELTEHFGEAREACLDLVQSLDRMAGSVSHLADLGREDPSR